MYALFNILIFVHFWSSSPYFCYIYMFLVSFNTKHLGLFFDPQKLSSKFFFRFLNYKFMIWIECFSDVEIDDNLMKALQGNTPNSHSSSSSSVR